ncbi:MAG TPA: orotate phosphoribosyltransferase [Armatimonadota bacterium]|nr:orotate phosphoribosyltransferase [Armatimonadota bacterium]
MTEAEVLRILAECGAIQDGHFVLSSGLHSGRYFQCAQVLQYPQHTARLCKELALRLRGANAQVVAGPAFGGIIVAYELARQLGVRAVFAERQEGKLTFRRGFSLAPGERVVIADDVITKGTSLTENADLARSLGAEIVGAGVILDRSGSADFGLRLEALAHATVDNYAPESCPLCARGLAPAKPGSRI